MSIRVTVSPPRELASSVAQAVTEADLYKFKAVTISYPIENDNISLFYTKKQVTVARISSIIKANAASEVNFTIRYDTNRSNTGTEIIIGGTSCSNTNTATIINTMNNAIIGANTFLWLETTTITGSVQELNITIDFA